MSDSPVRSIESIAVLGLGKVGLLAAELLADGGFHVVGYDTRLARHDHAFDVKTVDVSDPAALTAALADVDAVLSCLPYHLNSTVATLAHDTGIHYFDLTEDVGTTQTIRRLAETSKGLMAPQCGLAPGFVGIVAASQFESFDTCNLASEECDV